jgi:hypothetical protein
MSPITEPEGKTAFGFGQLPNVTPQWAKTIYRTVFAITTGLAAWVAATHLFTDSTKFEIILVLKFIDPVIYSLSQMIGIDSSGQEEFWKGKK